MMTKDGTQFCVECRKQTHYQLVKKKYKKWENRLVRSTQANIG